MEAGRYYRVAEHVFALNLPEAYYGQLTNYEPFRLQGDKAGIGGKDDEFLFTLSLTDDPMENLSARHIFTDASEDDMPRIEVYQTDDGWLVQVAVLKNQPVCCRLFATRDFRTARLCVLALEQMRFAVNNAVMLLYAFSTVKFNTLEMHAAVVVKEGLGYLFLGKSGTGKSTHAQQWLKAFPDAWLLNDDNPILRLKEEDGKTVLRVYGSPWSGKTPCYKNESAVVGGIVKLSQAKQNIARQMRLPEAYAYMLSSVSGMKIDPPSMDALYGTLSRLVETFPLHHLDCLPDTDAACVCYEAVRGNICKASPTT